MFSDLDLYFFSRVLHIIAVVFWIGGVAFVTCVLIPALKDFSHTQDKMALFETLEGKFAKQAKISTITAGVSGFYMLYLLQAWSRYSMIEYWWLHLMTLVWAVFSVVLFVFEPLFLHRWFLQSAQRDCDKAFKRLHIMHIFLLTISIIAIAGALLGSHGYL